MVGLWGSAVQSSGPNANERQGEGRACIATSARRSAGPSRRRPRWSYSRWWLLWGLPPGSPQPPARLRRATAQRARSPSSRRRASPHRAQHVVNHRGQARGHAGLPVERVPGRCVGRQASGPAVPADAHAGLARRHQDRPAAGRGRSQGLRLLHPARGASSVVVRVAGRQTARRDGLAVVEKAARSRGRAASRRQPGHPVELFDALRRERQRC